MKTQGCAGVIDYAYGKIIPHCCKIDCCVEVQECLEETVRQDESCTGVKYSSSVSVGDSTSTINLNARSGQFGREDLKAGAGSFFGGVTVRAERLSVNS